MNTISHWRRNVSAPRILYTVFMLTFFDAARMSAASDDLGIFEGRKLMIQSKIAECKSIQGSPPSCDADYTIISRMRFSKGKIFDETLSLKQSGNSTAAAETAKADSGIVYLLNQEIDLVTRPDLADNWRKLETQEIKKLVVSAIRKGNMIRLASWRVTYSEPTASGQKYKMNIDQFYVGQVEMMANNKCRFTPIRNESSIDMEPTGFGLGMMLPKMKMAATFRITDTICSVQ